MLETTKRVLGELSTHDSGDVQCLAFDAKMALEEIADLETRIYKARGILNDIARQPTPSLLSIRHAESLL